MSKTKNNAPDPKANQAVTDTSNAPDPKADQAADESKKGKGKKGGKGKGEKNPPEPALPVLEIDVFCPKTGKTEKKKVSANPDVPKFFVKGKQMEGSKVIAIALGEESDVLTKEEALDFLGRLVRIQSPSIIVE